MNPKQYSIRVRVWIDEVDGPFLGVGRVILLEKIKETGSITNAAKAIQMSYRQAWQLVEDMNQRSKTPLVNKQLGGKSGGGATLTATGEKAIQLFYELENKVRTFVENESKLLQF